MNDYKISITFSSGKTVQAKQGVCACDFLDELGANHEDIFAVRVNNEICSLNRALIVDSTLEAVLKSDKDGSEVYRRTLCFALAAALHNMVRNPHFTLSKERIANAVLSFFSRSRCMVRITDLATDSQIFPLQLAEITRKYIFVLKSFKSKHTLKN